jgi:transposase-like protein
VQTFSRKLKTLIGDSGTSVSALARKLGFSRQALYNWIDAKSLPSQRNLKLLLDALDLDQETKRSVGSLRDETRRLSPRIRSRKTAMKEWWRARKLKPKLKDKKMEVEDGETPYFDLRISPSGPWDTAFSVIPVLLRLKVTSYPAIFAQACEAMRRTKAKTAVIIVPEIKPHQYVQLFEHHRIELVTERQFMERDWFPPTEDQAELPFGGS